MAIFAGHHHIQHDKMDGGAVEVMAGLGGIGGKRGAEALLAQVLAQRLADIAGVIDDKDMGVDWISHGGTIRARGVG
jgi:hypothetical protein